MKDEIKTEDIIKSLRACAQGNPDACAACVYSGTVTCDEELCEDAADRLERLHRQHIKIQYNNEELTISEMCIRMDELRKKANAARLENELLRGTLAEMNETYDRTSCDERIMRQAIETYGVQAQCNVAIEEMAELTKAIVKIRRVADDYGKTQAALENLLEEIADVDIMIEQMKIMWGPKQVEEYRRKKLERLERRLEGVINDL